MTFPPVSAPRLIVLIGAAGSGKTTYARVRWRAEVILSLDECRRTVSGDPYDQNATADAVDLLLTVLDTRLASDQETAVDATNATRLQRAPLLDVAARYGIPAGAVVMDVPVATCLARNAERPGVLPGERWGQRVPDDVIVRQHKQVRDSIGSLKDEGFDPVTVIRGWPWPC